MKQLIIFAGLFLILESSSAQDSLQHNNLNAPTGKHQSYNPWIYSKAYCQEKSRSLNTAAWVLAGTGAVMGIAGLVVYENSLREDSWNELGNSFGGVILVAAGSAMVITSVPIFIRAGYYNKKALNMSAVMKLEPYQKGLAVQHFPAIGLSIPF